MDVLDLPTDVTIRDHRVDTALYLGGQWMDPTDRFPVIDPATKHVAGSVAQATTEHVVAAIDAADTAFEHWRALAPDTRADHLRRLHDSMLDHEDVLAALITLETGKPLTEAQGEVSYAREFARWYAEEARRVYGRTMLGGASADVRMHLLPQPIGVVATITPWNYPLVLLLRKVAAALAAGCTIVAKPSELAPLSAYAFARVCEEAELPPGTFNLVTADPAGPVGDVLVDDPRVRKISFTGSVEVGKSLMSASARTLTRVSLELGGHNPFLVFPTADLDRALDAVVHARHRNAGQTCVCTNRVYVHEDLLDDFVPRYVERLQALQVGDGFNPDTAIGPLINESGLHKVLAHVEDAVANGATVRCGGTQLTAGLPAGYFYAPTVLTGIAPSSMGVMKEETFGPVTPVLSFRDRDDVVRQANATEYGLAAYVFTENLREAYAAAEALEAGIVVVNQGSPSGVHAPQGGIKQSGVGVEGGAAGLEEFLYTKYVSLLP